MARVNWAAIPIPTVFQFMALRLLLNKNAIRIRASIPITPLIRLEVLIPWLGIISLAVSTMTMTTFGVWLWALVFKEMSVFTTLEEAVYYSLVAYTTLGLGDVVVPQKRSAPVPPMLNLPWTNGMRSLFDSASDMNVNGTRWGV